MTEEVLYNWKGHWDASVAYSVNDVIIHVNSGYLATHDVGPTDTTPDLDTDNWTMVAEQVVVEG